MPDPLIVIGGIRVDRVGSALQWTAGLSVDVDGCPNAYAPHGSGLRGRDLLQNALRDWRDDWQSVVQGLPPPHGWTGIVLGPDKQPIIQGPNDPAPGFYVSPTSLGDPKRREIDPRRYVDAWLIPYISIPPQLHDFGVAIGDVALVTYRDQSQAAIVADSGPRRRIGEGSCALARALGMHDSPIDGGVGAGVTVTLWPGSAATPAWPRANSSVAAQVATLSAANNIA